MAVNRRVIDVADQSELERVADEVRSTGKPALIRRNGEDLAEIRPVKPKPPKEPTEKRKRKTGILTRDDPLLRLIGIGDSGVEGGWSWRKRELLLKAHYDRRMK